MKRTRDVAFSECPICGKKPYVEKFDVTVAFAFCKGYGLHRHKMVRVYIPCEHPSVLIEKLAQKWNDLWFEEARFLFFANGNPFKEVNDDAQDT